MVHSRQVPWSPFRVAALLLAVTCCTACDLVALWLVAAQPAGSACRGSWECEDGLRCACGRCLQPGARASCETLDAGSQVPSCSMEQPICVRACGDFAPSGVATCAAGTWVCELGIAMADCPPDQCWGAPGPGEFCSAGTWTCAYGEVAPSGCLTPGQCGALDGGAVAPPGCLYTPDCPGTEPQCRATWCSAGTVEPAVCADARWVCARGVLTAACDPACGNVTPPPCYAGCGDNRVIDVATCTSGAFACARGVLREHCPAELCWGVRPAGSVGCVDGGWACGAAGAGPAGGCLTPGGCDALPAPTCHASACCITEALQPTCVDYAWTCPGLSSSDECAARPVCAAVDGGMERG